MMKPIRQSKNAYIQSLLVRGRKPRVEKLATGLSSDEAKEVERRLIADHKRDPWNCNTGDGGEGITPGALHCVYGLREPWEGGRTFYIGIAIDAEARLRQHIAEAKETTITLTKNPNLAAFLALLLNRCSNVGEILASNPAFRALFFRTRDDYRATWYCKPRVGCTPEADLIPLSCGWYLHRWLETKHVFRTVAEFERSGIRVTRNGKGNAVRK